MTKSSHISDLETLAASQWGMFTTAQAQARGVRRNQVSRLVNSLRVEPMCYGVYRFTAGAEADMADVKAAWLSVFPAKTAYARLSAKPHDAIVVGRTAAYALGAGDFLPMPYTFALSRRKQTSREDVRFLLCSVDDSDIVYLDGMPVTSFERTVYDLIRLDEDPDLVSKFIQDAVRKKGHVFDREKMSNLLSPLAARSGFSPRDGQSFADSLIANNAAEIQMKRAADSIGQVLLSLAANDSLRKQSLQMQAALVSSPAIERLPESLSSMSNLYSQITLPDETREALAKLTSAQFEISPGVKSALQNLVSSIDWQAIVGMAEPDSGLGAGDVAEHAGSELDAKG